MKNQFKDINKELQFYNTPINTVSELLKLIDFKVEGLDILEPSAGQGGILKILKENFPNNNYYFCEFLEYNKDIILNNIQNVSFVCNDFLKIRDYTNKKFDLIIANPPFNKNQDIIHFAKMIEICKTGGYIISILSNSWRKKLSQKKIKNFISLLNQHKVDLIDLDKNSFKDIGLNIDTCILKLQKEDNIFNNYQYDFSIKLPEIELEPVYLEDFQETIIKYEMFENNIFDEKIPLSQILLSLLK